MVLDGNQRYLVEEFAEDFEEGRMGRREMLRRVLYVTGGVAAAAAALREAGVQPAGAEPLPPVQRGGYIPATMPTEALQAPAAGTQGAATMPPSQITDALVVAVDDPAIVAEMVQFPGAAGTVMGYLARPNRPGRFPGIIVIHENRGLVEPNMDIARRYAKEGFVALAVDLLSRAGGTAAVNATDPMQATMVIGQATNDQRLADMNAAVAHMILQPFVDTSRGLGATGFCFGGGQTFLLAARNPEIRAAIPYYGSTEPDMLRTTKAAFMVVYAENDTRITQQAPAVEAALQAANVPYEIVIYPLSEHAFFNNTGMRYNPAAAADAWRQSLAWFRIHLGSPVAAS
jgi:carboxymethylenebutenolidase